MITMKTVKYFKDLGLVIVGEDMIHGYTGNPESDSITISSVINKGFGAHDGWTIAEFAWRTNTGDKPAFAGEIEVMHRSQNAYSKADYQISWNLCNCKSDIIKWRPLLNNKDESTADKSVVDAVNELEAEWPNGKNFIYISSKSNKMHRNKLDCTYQNHSGSGWDLLCDELQFNQCIEDMKTNWGTSGTYAEYKEECKSSFAVVDESPVFTKEMADNDELPEIGMLCKHKGVTKTVITPVDTNNKIVLISVDKGIYSLAHCNDIEPLTPPKTDKEKADGLFKTYLKDGNLSTHKSFSQAVIDGDFGDNIKWHKY
jgi:hypothetical protein